MAAKKANCVLVMIKRNMKCNPYYYEALLILGATRLEYCIQAWSPYHKKNIEILERVQKRAT